MKQTDHRATHLRRPTAPAARHGPYTLDVLVTAPATTLVTALANDPSSQTLTKSVASLIYRELAQ